MILQFTGITAWLVRQWVRVYTMGLPAGLKTSRREEIDSDLWEQTQDALPSGAGQRSITWQILGRLLFGIPDDLSWRVEHSKRTEGSGYMHLAKHLIRPGTYINLIAVLVGMLILFPIGVGAFVLAVVAAVAPPTLLISVFIYKWAQIGSGPFIVDTFPKALVVSLIGLVLVLVEIFIANAIVSALRRFVSLRVGNFRFGQIA